MNFKTTFFRNFGAKKFNNEKKKSEKIIKNAYNNKKFQSPGVLIVPYMVPAD